MAKLSTTQNLDAVARWVSVTPSRVIDLRNCILSSEPQQKQTLLTTTVLCTSMAP